MFDSTSEPNMDTFKASDSSEQTLVDLLRLEYAMVQGNLASVSEFLQFAESYLQNNPVFRVDTALDGNCRITLTNNKVFLLSKGLMPGDMQPSHSVPISGRGASATQPANAIEVK